MDQPVCNYCGEAHWRFVVCDLLAKERADAEALRVARNRPHFMRRKDSPPAWGSRLETVKALPGNRFVSADQTKVAPLGTVTRHPDWNERGAA